MQRERVSPGKVTISVCRSQPSKSAAGLSRNGKGRAGSPLPAARWGEAPDEPVSEWWPSARSGSRGRSPHPLTPAGFAIRVPAARPGRGFPVAAPACSKTCAGGPVPAVVVRPRWECGSRAVRPFGRPDNGLLVIALDGGGDLF